MVSWASARGYALGLTSAMVRGRGCVGGGGGDEGQPTFRALFPGVSADGAVLKGDARVKLHCLLVAQLRGARPGTTNVGGSAWTDERVTRARLARARLCASAWRRGGGREKSGGVAESERDPVLTAARAIK